MSILNIASQMEAELNAKEKSLKDKELEIAKETTTLKALKKELETKRKELVKADKELTLREKEVINGLTNIRRDTELTEALASVEVSKDNVKKMLKEANEKNADADMKLAEVTKRELALAQKQKEYKDKIKKEIVEGFLKGIKL